MGRPQSKRRKQNKGFKERKTEPGWPGGHSGSRECQRRRKSKSQHPKTTGSVALTSILKSGRLKAGVSVRILVLPFASCL